MLEYIHENLQDNESVLWTGKPDKLNLMDPPFNRSIIAQWIIAALLVVFVIWYVISAEALGIETGRLIGISAVILLIAFGVVFDPYNTIKKMKSRVLYCITNKRVIMVYKSDPMKMHFEVLDDVKEMSYEILPSGYATVYIGKRDKYAREDSRSQSINPAMWNRKLPLMLYSVDLNEVLEHLPERLTENARSLSQSQLAG